MGLKELQANNVVAATPDQLNKIRSPEFIFTDGYLDDPIQYRPDERFHPKTVTKQLSNLPNQLRRDFAEFLQIDRNSDTPQMLTINMFSTLTRRDAYVKVIGPRATFRQFGVTL